MKRAKNYPKLSRLQKTILILAHKQHKRGMRLYSRDVLVAYYGFQTAVGTWAVRGGGQVFRVQTIGGSRYRSASVAVVKSFHRLRARGLVEYGYGVELTPAGRTVARKLRPPEG